jgi:hypothetical protein
LIGDSTPDDLRAHAAAGTHVSLEVRAAEADLAEAVRGIPEVEGLEVVDRRGGVLRARVAVRAGTDPREALAAAIAGRGMGLLAMSLSTASLEDVFMQLVTREEAP